MPKSKRQKRGNSAQKRRVYDPVYTDRITKDELQKALREKLTLAELTELEREIRTMVEDITADVCARAQEEVYKRQYAVTIRVLRDRFGFGKKRINRLWSSCMEYLHDIETGLISTDDMLKTLENEDGITIDWHVV